MPTEIFLKEERRKRVFEIVEELSKIKNRYLSESEPLNKELDVLLEGGVPVLSPQAESYSSVSDIKSEFNLTGTIFDIIKEKGQISKENILLILKDKFKSEPKSEKFQGAISTLKKAEKIEGAGYGQYKIKEKAET